MFANKLIENSIKMAKEKGGKNGLDCIAVLVPESQVLSDAALALPEDMPGFNDGAADNTCGSLHGVPILVKDNIDVKGLPTTAGSIALADNVALEDAPVIKNLRKNGAVIIGKTNLTEFANYVSDDMPNGYSSYGGQVIHAINTKADPGGSSSGSGVAVSAGIVPMAVGTDTSFSVIACAMYNGICGIKPPIGVLSSKGIVPIAKTLDSAGAMAANFTDAIKLYNAMRDEPMAGIAATQPSSLRIAINNANYDKLSDAQKVFYDDVAKKLRNSGCYVGKVLQEKTPFLNTIMQYEFGPCLEDYLKSSNSSIRTLAELIEYYKAHPDTMMKYGCNVLEEALDGERAGGLTAPEYMEAMRNRAESITKVTGEIADYDAVIMTGPTNIMHFCGLPSATVASNITDEMGINRCLILYGSHEKRLYSAALAIEKMVNLHL